MPANPQVPEPTVLRLSVYLRVLSRLEAEETDRASSATIGVRAGVRPEQVRKDLSYFGEFGRPGLGYSVPELRRHLARILRADRELRVVLLGVGRLGSALLGYPGFAERGFQVVGAFDSDPEKVGVRIGPHVVMDVQHLRFVVAELGRLAGHPEPRGDVGQCTARRGGATPGHDPRVGGPRLLPPRVGGPGARGDGGTGGLTRPRS